MSSLLLPPPGGRHNKGPAFLTVALLFTILAFISVILRVYVRVWIKPNFGWDDGIIIFATVGLRAHLLSSMLTITAPCNCLNWFQYTGSHCWLWSTSILSI